MNADQTLADIKAAMRGHGWRLEAVLTMSSGVAVQVYAKTPGSKRYSKVGPVLFPPGGGTVADTLAMLSALAVEEPV